MIPSTSIGTVKTRRNNKSAAMNLSLRGVLLHRIGKTNNYLVGGPRRKSFLVDRALEQPFVKRIMRIVDKFGPPGSRENIRSELVKKRIAGTISGGKSYIDRLAINMNRGGISIRDVVNHEAFHLKPIVGNSETLAHVAGGLRSRKGTISPAQAMKDYIHLWKTRPARAALEHVAAGGVTYGSARGVGSLVNKGDGREMPQKTAVERIKIANRPLQGRLNFQGLSISIENRRGSVREGEDSDGTEWRTKMKHPYGYIRGTLGADGDHVDCFIGPDKDAEKAYIVHIKNPETDKYDEDKVMLGFNTKEDAEASFRHHYDNPGKYLLSIDTMTIDELKARFDDDKEEGRRTRMLKAAEDAFLCGFIDTLEKNAGAGTYAASMLIPTFVLATTGSTIGALSNKDNRGKGALVGAGIGTGMGVAGGIPIGRSISRILANNKNLSQDLSKKIHNIAESIGKRFGEGTAKGVKKEMNPFSIFKSFRPRSPQP